MHPIFKQLILCNSLVLGKELNPINTSDITTYTNRHYVGNLLPSPHVTFKENNIGELILRKGELPFQKHF